MKKRVIAVMLVLVLALTMFTGCGTKKTGNTNSDEQMVISVLAIGKSGDHSGEYVTTLLEKQFNIKLESQFLSNEEYTKKRAMLFSAGNIPDIIYHLDPAYVKSDVSQDFLAEVDYETIKKYAPDYVDYINENEPRVWTYGYVDGKNYGVPNLYNVGIDPQTTLWRKDWLDKAGVEKLPETLEELHDTFVKVSNADVDGNGKKDTYCMSAAMTSYNTGVFSDIFGAYGILPFNWQNGENGSVVYGGTNPKMKEVLSLLNKWYKEGLIHPEFITDTATTMNTKFQNGQLLMNFMNGKNIYKKEPNTIVPITKQLNPDAEFAYTLPVKGPEGSRGGFVFGLGGHIICFGRQIKDQPEKLQKILEMINYINTDEEFMLKSRLGELGTHYKYIDESQGLAGGIEYLPPYDNSEERDKQGITGLGVLHSQYGYVLLPVRLDTYAKYRINEERQIFSNIENPQQYFKTDVFMKTDVVPGAEKSLANIRSSQSEYMMKIIMGEYPVDKYDDFIKAFNGSLGGAELTAEANKFYSVQEEIIKKMK